MRRLHSNYIPPWSAPIPNQNNDLYPDLCEGNLKIIKGQFTLPLYSV